MKTLSQIDSLSFALALAATFAVTTISSHAQSALATISGGSIGGGKFEYTITLDNNGSDNLNSFWYGWTLSGNNLPSSPSFATNSIGWANDLSGTSIMWQNTASAGALTPGSSATFSFITVDSLSAITAPPHGESVAYTSDTIQINQGVSGQSTAVFSPSVVATPEPSSFGLMLAGLPLLAASLRRLKTARKSGQ